VPADLLGLPCVHEEAASGFVERMIPAGEAYLQLLEATGPGIIERSLDRRGPGPHHAAFEASDIDEAVADLRSRGVRMVDQTPRPGGMGTRVALVHPAACPGLLLEPAESPAAGSAGKDDQMVERS
jgi:methylmalonyl-CoA/ethylmalonyl-CoA epimerase